MSGPRVLVATMQDDYGIPERGRSYDYWNILLPLRSVFPGTILFDYMARLHEVGRERMNAELIEVVERERPDLVLVTMYTDQFDDTTIRRIRSIAVTVAYFMDDIWRTEYALHWARWFDFVSSPDPAGPERYAKAGLDNGIWSPFAFNEDVYVRAPRPPEHEVSFVGGWHPYREWTHAILRRAGVSVAAYGAGWPNGRVSTEDAVRIMNATKVNLNTWNGSDWEPVYLLSSVRALSWSIRTAKSKRAVKGRAFEIAGCGGFQITYDIPEVQRYFDVGREIVTYRGSRDLVAKVRRYLSDDAAREAVADAGWRRAQRDHRASDRMRALVMEALGRAPRHS